MTKIQKSNIAKLAKALLTRRPKIGFNMSHIATNRGRAILVKSVKNECGTSCCALGHGPLFVDPGKVEEGWEEYSDRVFGVLGGHMWLFLFSQFWPSDKKQFAARAHRFLTKGAPRKYDYIDTYPLAGPRDFDRWIIEDNATSAAK